MRPLSCILIVGVAASCSVGPRPDKFPPAREPAGATIQLRLRGKRVVTGELLAVQDSGLLVRDSSRILLVPNRAVQNGSLVSGGAGPFRGKPVGDTRERLRLLSRYPSGVSGELLTTLLAAYGRDSVETVP
jgi:hypothetical protein